MDAERHARISELFVAARELPAGERGGFLDRACDGDADLASRVLALLAHDGAEAIVDRPLTGSVPSADPMPDRIGRYEIVDLLGEGGMGTVYRARQDDPEREVALKVLRRGIFSPSMLGRFRHEARVLGRLQHPGIAQIFEAGSTGEGRHAQPYFAMELVDGEPLDEYVAGRDLRIRDKLELVVKICDAMEHAHQKGVVHRDLKPANILVDERGEPKILDFGVARATDSDVRTTTLQTDVGQLLGTVPYMSPEQVTGDPTALDSRSDVYAIGVVLYELLAGRLPHDLREKTIPEAARIIRDEEPTRLSTGDTTLRGDLETIVGKALEKDPDRRYPSVSGLAADLRRYLSHEPIVARRPSLAYQARLFARRNRAFVIATAIVMLALVATTTVSTIFAVNESRQRHTTERIVVQLERMLRSPDPHRHGADLKVVEMLDHMIVQLDADTDEPPEVEAAVRHAIGSTYSTLGRTASAIVQLERAVELYAEIDARGPPRVDALGTLAVARSERQDFPGAEAACREAIRLLDEHGGPSNQRYEILGTFASMLRNQGRLAEAEAALRESMRLRRLDLDDDVFTAIELRNLTRLQIELDRLPDAERSAREALGIVRSVVDERHPIRMAVLNDLAPILRAQRKHGECLEIAEESWRICQAHRPLASRDWFRTAYEYLRAVAEAGRRDEAERLLLDLLARLEAEPGRHADAVLGVRRQLSQLYDAWGDPAKAAALRAWTPGAAAP